MPRPRTCQCNEEGVCPFCTDGLRAGDAEFLSLTICEDGALRPTRNEFGAVIDKFGVYRGPEEERDSTHPDFYRELGRWA